MATGGSKGGKAEEGRCEKGVKKEKGIVVEKRKLK